MMKKEIKKQGKEKNRIEQVSEDSNSYTKY